MCVARQPISRLYPLDTDDANALGGRTQLLIARCELEAHIHGEQEVRSVAGGQARPVRDSEERPRFPMIGHGSNRAVDNRGQHRVGGFKREAVASHRLQQCVNQLTEPDRRYIGRVTGQAIGDGTADRTRLIVEGSFERSRGIEHEWH